MTQDLAQVAPLLKQPFGEPDFRPAQMHQLTEAGDMSVLLAEVTTRLQVPHTMVHWPAYLVFLQGSPPDPSTLAGQQERAQIAKFASSLAMTPTSFLVLWAPNHYTCLQVTQGQSSSPTLQFFDSLKGGHQPSRDSAAQVLATLWPTQSLTLPASCCPAQWCQTDGWSCGFQVVELVERSLRQGLGQPPVPCSAVPAKD